MSASHFLLARISMLQKRLAMEARNERRAEIEEEIRVEEARFVAAELAEYLAHEDEHVAAQQEGPLTSAEVLAEVIGFIGIDPLPAAFRCERSFLPGGEYRE